jgi:hypothetical protein
VNLTGCVRDVSDSRDFRWGISHLAGSLPVIGSTTEIDLREWMPPIRTQRYNNCVAHSAVAQLEGISAVKGVPIATPSTMFLYANARILAPSHPLTDTGCSYRQLLKGMSSRTILEDRGLVVGLGCVPESDYPEDSSPVNAVPPDDLYRDGANAVIKNYYRIADGDINGLIGALQRQQFPSLCLVVDQAFEDLGGNVYHTAGGALLGGHALTVVGYSEKAHAFRFRNSWGVDWGQDGYGWIDQGYVQDHCYDHWVLTLLPGAA